MKRNIAGMLTGLGITCISLLPGVALPLLPPTSSALIGAPLVILVMIVVSLLTPPPPEAIRRFLAAKVHSP